MTRTEFTVLFLSSSFQRTLQQRIYGVLRYVCEAFLNAILKIGREKGPGDKATISKNFTDLPQEKRC